MSELEGRISSALSRPAPVGPIMPSILVTLLLILGKGVSVCLGDVQKREIIHEASLFFFLPFSFASVGIWDLWILSPDPREPLIFVE